MPYRMPLRVLLLFWQLILQLHISSGNSPIAFRLCVCSCCYCHMILVFCSFRLWRIAAEFAWDFTPKNPEIVCKMVLRLSKERLPAELPSLMPIRRKSSASKLNAHAAEFVPNKRLVYAQIAPEKMMPTTGKGVRQVVEMNTADPPSSVDAGGKLLPVVKSKKSHSVAVSKSPKNSRVLKTENLLSQVEEGSADPVACSPPRVKPAVSDDLKAKIVKQAEFYFSDANLATDNFLLKLLKKDPEGFVTISVVASFSEIKNLIKNHGIVAAALKTSSQLVVSKDGKKVRRTKLILDTDLKGVQARTVVAENFPENHSTEDITQLFGGIGIIQMVRICHPGTFDNAKHAVMEYPKADILVSNKLHALVVYESVNEAERAVKELTNESNWRTGLRVRLLLRRMGSQAKNMPAGKKVEAEVVEGSDGDEESTGSIGSPDKSGDEHAQRADASQGYLRGESPDAGTGFFEGRRGKGRGWGWARGRGQLNTANWSSGGTPPQNCSKFLGGEVLGKRPAGPRMPDGTRGFTLGRGRLVAACAS